MIFLYSKDVLIHPDSELLADSGYQGINKYHICYTYRKKEFLVHLKPKLIALSKKRILIENINRLCKIFRCVKEVFRGKHKNYGLTWRSCCSC